MWKYKNKIQPEIIDSKPWFLNQGSCPYKLYHLEAMTELLEEAGIVNREQVLDGIKKISKRKCIKAQS